MKQSILIPVLSTGFEMNYFGRNNPSHDWLMENNESSEHFSQVENLFRLHRHDVMEILVFLDGECEFFVKDIRIPFEEEMLLSSLLMPFIKLLLKILTTMSESLLALVSI